MNTEKTTGGAEKPRDPNCFEEWLHMRLREQPDRQDEVGRVARWVLKRMKPGHPARWTPEDILLARHGHAYDVPAHYWRYLRHVATLTEESIDLFFHVFDRYLADDSAEYDRKIEEVGKKLGRTFGGGGNGDDGGTTTDEPEDDHDSSCSWESWNRFFFELYGQEGLGYDLDEDDHPKEPDGSVEGR